MITALPFIARITGGYATVTDKTGIRIRTFDSLGKEIEAWRGTLFELAKAAGESGQVRTGPSEIIEGAEAWALPLGDYVIASSNLERIQREQELQDSLNLALPFIARVAGGEAVLFDENGKRTASVNYDGQPNTSFIGKISNAAQKAMQTGRPVIGESMSAHGAIGVRIPITPRFGFGFNNEHGVLRQQKLLEEVKKFQYARYNFTDIVGTSVEIQKVKSMAQYVANGISSIIILGETGTGKELFAQSIHNCSERRSKPFIAVNCGALPTSLIESYLFGYEEGAFTGAKKSGSSGAFEQANGGTLFLDELGEMDINLQSKLLRVLQEREVTRIGGSKPIRIDVRIVSSTNRDLAEMVAAGTFRQDLYYRLNVVQLKIPALRERPEDIPALIKTMISRYNHLLGKFVTSISDESIKRLREHTWPGNVRELQNCLEYAINIIGINENVLELTHFPQYIQNLSAPNSIPRIETLAEAVRLAERDAIMRALALSGQSKKAAAHRLGISTTTLWRKLVETGLESGPGSLKNEKP
ncbi:sigma-54 interaction domain-containing protein [Anaeroselena agilis]|uniref:Sigma 54-interacting transcriptional regulator n=1 Tax=Anaeroselena agilis TaxID=3063788 RepID=A0ABU3P2Q7_9FIRM|nr:sigma 54-interacting transcriptional regulator [Selenomonadales bacterium 4137-cl]